MHGTSWASAEKRDRRNTTVGWIILLALIVLAFFVVAAIAAESDSPKQTTVSCSYVGNTVSCVRS